MTTRPYMKFVTAGAESQVDFLGGSSRIGAINVEITDPPTIAGDQDSGIVTALVATGDGLLGHRAVVRQEGSDGVMRVVWDGIVGDHSLNSSLSAYTFQLRDPRERERRRRVFVKADNALVFPKGVDGGYGRIYDRNGVVTQMVPDDGYRTGVYTQDPTHNRGIVNITVPHADSWFNDAQLARLHPQPVYDETLYGYMAGFAYTSIIIEWRDAAAGGAWTQIVDMPYLRLFSSGGMVGGLDGSVLAYPELILTGSWNRGPSGDRSIGFWLVGGTGVTLPTNGQRVDFRIRNNLEPDADFPLWVEGYAFAILERLYNGIYSAEDPLIRSDATWFAAHRNDEAWLAFAITEPVDNLRDWVEPHIYKALGWAPALTPDFKIRPISPALPDASVTLLNLDNNNTTHTGSTWQRTKQQVINEATYVYQREFLRGVQSGGQFERPVDRIVRRKIVHRYFSTTAALIGSQDIKYEPVTVRSQSASADSPVAGIHNESGAALALKVMRRVVDRFKAGAPVIVISALESDAGVRAATVGDWCLLGMSWLPDPATGRRGLSRVGQIVRIRDLAPHVREFEIIDGGPDSAPLAQPVVSAPTINAAFQASVSITSVPAGAECRVDYAFADALPTNPGDWKFAGRGPSGITILTPPMPDGATVFTRARSEAEGRRPSAWTATQQATLGGTARALSVTVEIDQAGFPLVKWQPNSLMGGARIRWALHNPGDAPVMTGQVDKDADDLQATLTSYVPLGMQITVDVEAWTGFAAGAVTGLAGAVTRAQIVNTGVQHGAPAPKILSVTAEATAEAGAAGAQVHVQINMDRNTKVVHVYRRQASTAPGQPILTEAFRVASIVRPEGDWANNPPPPQLGIPQLGGWTFELDLTTTASWYNTIAIQGEGYDGRFAAPTYAAAPQAVDTGPAPTAGPSNPTITKTGTTNQLNWTSNDTASRVRVRRNGVIMFRTPSLQDMFGLGAFVDGGLYSGTNYTYEFQAIRPDNGQTTAWIALATGAGGGSDDPVAPAWVAPYPDGAVGPGGAMDAYVALQWTSTDPVTTSITIEQSTDQIHWSNLRTETTLNPGAPIEDRSHAFGTQRYLRLRANRSGGNTPLYSLDKQVTWGISSP